MNKAISKLSPLFYMPSEIPAFQLFMWTEANSRQFQKQINVLEQQQQQQTPSVTNMQQQQTPSVTNMQQQKQQQQTPSVTNMQQFAVIKNKNNVNSLISFASEKSYMSVSEEMDERQKMALYFNESKQNKLLLKDAGHRITYADIDSILSDLMTSPKQEASTTCFGLTWVNLPLCIACAQYYHKDIVVGNAELATFVRFLGKDKDKDKVGDKDDTLYLLLDTQKRKLVQSDVHHVMIESWFELWDFRKPLKAITNYKLDDLNTMLHRLPFVGALNKKSSKQELYTAIEHYCYGLTGQRLV